jgi:DNA-directed RNA polymerase specialized sigma24 family protein
MITKNHVLDFIRSKKAELARYDKKKQEIMNDDLKQIQVPEIDEIVEKEWELFIANLALSNIRDSFKNQAIEVFELLLSGKSAQEISEMLDLKKNTVHQMGLRVKKKMIEEIIRLKDEME